MRTLATAAMAALVLVGFGAAPAMAGESAAQTCSGQAKVNTTMYAYPNYDRPLRPMPAGRWEVIHSVENGFYLMGPNDQESGWVPAIHIRVPHPEDC